MDKPSRHQTMFMLLLLFAISFTLILSSLVLSSPAPGMLFRQVANRLKALPPIRFLRRTMPCPKDIQVTEEKVALNLSAVSYDALLQALGGILQTGGRYSPGTCKALEKVALIIPYRDREKNLHILLRNLVPFLVRQQLEFTIFVVEQTKDYLFNRCLMFNVGFVEAQKRGNFTCFIIQDTDLIPRDNRNLYRCDKVPRHFVTSRGNETWKQNVSACFYRLPYPSFIGGVLGLRKDHMNKSNGCSNYFYGWGSEDDDLKIRMEDTGLDVVRYPGEIGAYYTLKHEKQTRNPQGEILRQTTKKRMKKDGLNSLQYELVDAKEKELYTWLLVKPPPPPASIYGTTPTP
ncbi:beta-1,4-N-acetylgalactosaminyltransferase bre-4-like [Pomacea canaliculata]|uniref:beta-1,4-N-acetylgalactosaminyltransferase bre-4-like n=1 Tax=Pomacea canaliculata TaxID=400727 RepID=UPI000D72AA7B|nr:beta-1,4-N-acetylgalactosaminyltransferase bre-4-like [Pomacea canaliculata]